MGQLEVWLMQNVLTWPFSVIKEAASIAIDATASDCGLSIVHKPANDNGPVDQRFKSPEFKARLNR